MKIMNNLEDLSPEADAEFGNALKDVFSFILKRAEDERKQTEPWKQLFVASEHGLAGILDNAEHQMMAPVLSLCDIIQEKFGIPRISDKLFQLLQALPFAMNAVTKSIEDTQGRACSADKARRVYYEEVLAEIELIKQGSQNAS